MWLPVFEWQGPTTIQNIQVATAMSNVITTCWITWSCTQKTSHWKLRNQGLQTPYYNVAGWARYTCSDYVLFWHVSSVMLRMNNDLAQLRIPWVTCRERKTFSRRIQKQQNWRLYTRLNNNQNETHWMSPRFLKKNMFLIVFMHAHVRISYIFLMFWRRETCWEKFHVSAGQSLTEHKSCPCSN